jgi:2,3-bisphosphoglycerate-independent phosphoglycerate mutase
VYPIVVFLLDGLADRAHEALGGRTGNEAAATPNLDALRGRGSAGCSTRSARAGAVERGGALVDARLPARRVPGRAVFEALGRGQE